MNTNSEPISKMPLTKVAQELHRAIDRTENPEALRVLAALTHQLQPVLDEALIAGIGRELNLWAGLKLDTPAMGAQYGEGIKGDYPEVFKQE